ncbi:MAG: site-2 protease family protein [Myxococcales bacterium]|nr:site-2 protease family protein [Myxococcales bacterium]
MVSILAFIALIGVLITAHEAGHFIVAKLSGVKVEVFSIGFGRPIVKLKRGETEYRIAWLPLGGYVRMLGDPASGDPMSPGSAHVAEADRGRSLMAKPPLVRMAIYAAGPAMNLILPFLILVPVFALSDRYDQVTSSTIGALDEALPAWKAGLREGDVVEAINGEAISTFWQVARFIDTYSEGDGPLRMDVRRGDAPVHLEVTPERVEQTHRLVNFTRSYFRIGYQPMFQAADVAVARPDGPLAAAGVRTFDRVLTVDGKPTPRYIDAQQALAAVAAGAEVDVQVERDAPLDPRLPFLAKRVTHTLRYRGDGAAADLRHAGPCISSVAPDSAAGEVLRPGDCILSIDGVPHTLGAFVQNRLGRRPEEPKTLEILRDGERLTVTLAPRKVTLQDPMAGEIQQWQLGLVLLARPDGFLPLDSVENPARWGHAWAETTQRVGLEIEMLVDSLTGMFTGRVSPTQLSGPITIFRLAGEYARAGMDVFLRFLILLSLSIGLINLLPVPVLDGGQILVAFTELIIRRPLPAKVQDVLLRVGVVLVLTLIVFALGNDLVREWRIQSAD